MKRRAVVILGRKNSGRTTTVKHFVKSSDFVCNSIFKTTNLNGEDIKVFIVGKSPSERGETLQEIIRNYNEGNLPENIIVAEQINGDYMNKTVDFLITNDYKITFFVIHEPTKFNRTHWDCVSGGLPSTSDLDKRAQDIKRAFTPRVVPNVKYYEY